MHLSPAFGGIAALRASVGSHIYAIPQRVQANKECAASDADRARCFADARAYAAEAVSGDHSRTAMLKDTCFCGYAFAVQNKDCGDGHLMAFADGQRERGATRARRAVVGPEPATLAAGARDRQAGAFGRAALVPAGALPEAERRAAGAGARTPVGAGFVRCWGLDERLAGNFLVRADTFLHSGFEKKKTYAQLEEGVHQGRPGPRRWTLVTAEPSVFYTLPAAARDEADAVLTLSLIHI